MKEKKLLIISTGGTIAQTKGEGDGYTVNKGDEGARTFIASLGKALDAAKIREENVGTMEIMDIDSSNLLPGHWVKIIDTIVENYDSYDMFLLTHGTNTMGYTTAALSFALGNLGKPVVVTGSQVPLKYAGTDAIANLENGVLVAAHPGIAGVLTVFGSRIIIGTRTKKMTESSRDAFASFKTKPLGEMTSRGVRIEEGYLNEYLGYYGSKSQLASGLEVHKNFDMRIASITEFPGMNSDLLISIAQSPNIKGFVLRTSGAGDPNVLTVETEGKLRSEGKPYENLRQGFEYLRDNKIPIVVTTHAPDGVASMDINTPGKIAKELGVIPAWDMSIESMTVKLGWLLGQGYSYGEICSKMVKSLRGEIVDSK